MGKWQLTTIYIALPLLLASRAAHHQVQPPVPASPSKPEATVSGCVKESAKSKGNYLLDSGDRCFLLRGNFNQESLSNHEVVLEGTVLDPEGMFPLRLQVTSTRKIGGSCSRVCIPVPPGTRGVEGNKQKPGSNAGTSGLSKPPQTN